MEIFNFDFTGKKSIDEIVLEVESNGDNNMFMPGKTGYVYELIPPANHGQNQNQIVLSPVTLENLTAGLYIMQITLPACPNFASCILTSMDERGEVTCSLNKGVNIFTVHAINGTCAFLEFTCLSEESALFVLASWKCSKLD